MGERLAELLGEPVVALREPAPDELPDAPVVLLENLRFDPGEEADDPAFAGRLAELADAYVDDAFGAVHRAHASVDALPDLMRSSGRAAVAGRLVEREVEVLSTLLHEPDRPYVAILGGAKVSDKLAVIDSLIDRVDALLIGGAMAFTLIAADGGRSPTASSNATASTMCARPAPVRAERGVLIEVPQDVVAAEAISLESKARTVPATEIPRGLMGLDIGPKTVAHYARDHRRRQDRVVERPDGGLRTRALQRGHARGGDGDRERAGLQRRGRRDSLLAVKRAELTDGFDHLSTGGGASLEFLEGRELPGLTILEDRP